MKNFFVLCIDSFDGESKVVPWDDVKKDFVEHAGRYTGYNAGILNLFNEFEYSQLDFFNILDKGE